MSLEELERCLHLEESSESDNSEIDEDEHSASSEYSGNGNEENKKNQECAIEYDKNDTNAEDNKPLDCGESEENKNEEEDNL